MNNCGDDWSNQMPVASGLIDGSKGKRAAVDLVYRVGASVHLHPI